MCASCEVMRIWTQLPRCGVQSPSGGHAGNAKVQDEMLQQLPAVEEHADYNSLKNELLPRCAPLHMLCSGCARQRRVCSAHASLCMTKTAVCDGL